MSTHGDSAGGQSFATCLETETEGHKDGITLPGGVALGKASAALPDAWRIPIVVQDPTPVTSYEILLDHILFPAPRASVVSVDAQILVLAHLSELRCICKPRSLFGLWACLYFAHLVISECLLQRCLLEMNKYMHDI